MDLEKEIERRREEIARIKMGYQRYIIPRAKQFAQELAETAKGYFNVEYREKEGSTGYWVDVVIRTVKQRPRGFTERMVPYLSYIVRFSDNGGVKMEKPGPDMERTVVVPLTPYNEAKKDIIKYLGGVIADMDWRKYEA